MIVSLTALDFDPLGSVQITPSGNSDLDSIARRVNRTATLDGGAAFNDMGFSHGDRDMVVRWMPTSRAQVDRVARMVRLHQSLRITTPEGVFEVRPVSFNPQADEARLELYVARKLSED